MDTGQRLPTILPEATGQFCKGDFDLNPCLCVCVSPAPQVPVRLSPSSGDCHRHLDRRRPLGSSLYGPVSCPDAVRRGSAVRGPASVGSWRRGRVGGERAHFFVFCRAETLCCWRAVANAFIGPIN